MKDNFVNSSQKTPLRRNDLLVQTRRSRIMSSQLLVVHTSISERDWFSTSQSPTRILTLYESRGKHEKNEHEKSVFMVDDRRVFFGNRLSILRDGF